MLNSEAWQNATPVERSVFVMLKKHYTGANNGTINYSIRQAAKESNISPNTAGKALKGLLAKGFIKLESKGFKGSERIASKYSLTDEFNHLTRKPASHDYLNWKVTIDSRGAAAAPFGFAAQRPPDSDISGIYINASMGDTASTLTNSPSASIADTHGMT